MMNITETGKKWGFETEEDVISYILEGIADNSIQTMNEALHELDGYFEGSFEPETIKQFQEALEEAEEIREEEAEEQEAREAAEAEEYRKDIAYLNAEYLKWIA